MVRKPLAAALLAVLAASCHTITEELPKSSTKNPTGPAPIPVVVVPIPVLTPAPTPAATPTPAPGTPTPAPTAAPPNTASCGLPAGNGSGNNCPLEHPSFLPQVEDALDQVIREHPDLFNLKDTRGGCDNCYYVKNSDGYWDAVTAAIQQRGLCATNDGEELAVKNTNSWNDQYDIITGDGYIRRQLGSYRSTCHPAWF
jgi:hypothetical protein